MKKLKEEIKDTLDNFFGELEGIHVLPMDKDIHDEYTDKILKLFEKRIDEKLADDRRVIGNLISTGNFKSETHPAIVRLVSQIDTYVGIKEMLNA